MFDRGLCINVCVAGHLASGMHSNYNKSSPKLAFERCVVVQVSGMMGVLADHAATLAELKPGVVTVIREEGAELDKVRLLVVDAFCSVFLSRFHAQ